jgi:hypothetical protein
MDLSSRELPFEWHAQAFASLDGKDLPVMFYYCAGDLHGVLRHILLFHPISKMGFYLWFFTASIFPS